MIFAANFYNSDNFYVVLLNTLKLEESKFQF